MSCGKCNDSGLIPFEKDGKVIPNAWIDCPHCYQQPVEHYRPLSPASIDYACSDTFRSHSYQYCNQSDPGYIPPEPEASPPQEIFHYHVDLSKQILRNLEGQVNYLQGKVTEKQVKQPKTSGYKGIK